MPYVFYENSQININFFVKSETKARCDESRALYLQKRIFLRHYTTFQTSIGFISAYYFNTKLRLSKTYKQCLYILEHIFYLTLLLCHIFQPKVLLHRSQPPPSPPLSIIAPVSWLIRMMKTTVNFLIPQDHSLEVKIFPIMAWEARLLMTQAHPIATGEDQIQ